MAYGIASVIFFGSSLLLSSSIRRRFYPQRSSGQAVVTGVVHPPPRYVPSSFIRAKRVSNCYIQEKKLTVCVCVCVDVRLILVLVLGRQIVYGQNTVYLCLSKYIVFENTHTNIATAASETEGVAAVSCMESHMNRRPLGCHGHHFAGVQRTDYVLLRLGRPQGKPTERGE